ncbi:hypothetical protein [Algoriphagus hitonicola]|uniref:Lipoprotein n=1 Tax=Algoriphagus hitonicola TaxID=435880 RepID=A0A1I2QFL8_9BACT|nr:hypothetical protein [Algoriphagus hitonicola]SFG27088.1 hypothetical protein SAMN04487988_102257 [Algoriphagus hitonicola]
MLHVKKFLKVFLILSIVPIFYSCSEDVDDTQDRLELGPLDLFQLKINLNPVTVDLSTYPLQKLLKDLSRELYEINMENVNSRVNPDEGMQSYAGYALKINKRENVALITPLEGSVKNSTNARMLTDDDIACRGDHGDGWKLYDTCMADTCVTEAVLAAAEDQGEPGVNECLDLRVVRTLLNPKVCARTIPCN